MYFRLPGLILALLLCWAGAAWGQSMAQTTVTHAAPADEDVFFLVARPSFLDASYKHTVLLAAPLRTGGHIGVILNRPTNRTLFSLFPEHEPSKLVNETVRYGGPFSSNGLIALVRSETSPGEGTVPVMKDVFIAFHASTIDKIIEQTPNSARYFVGYVGWAPGELNSEIDRHLWAIVHADRDTIFQKDTSTLWEDLIARSRQIQATIGTGASSRSPPYSLGTGGSLRFPPYPLGTGGSSRFPPYSLGTGGSLRFPPYPPVASLWD